MDDPKAALAQIDSILQSQRNNLLKLKTEVQSDNSLNQNVHSNSEPHSEGERKVDKMLLLQAIPVLDKSNLSNWIVF